MNICVVAEDYPAKDHPLFAFVENLCKALVRSGHHVSVIAPQSLTKIIIRGEKRLPFKTEADGVIIYRPLFITVGNASISLNYKLFSSAVSRVFKRIHNNIDVCYGHFWHSAFCLYPAAKKYNKPLFVASGESEIELHQYIDINKLQDFCKYVRGVICVSTKNLDESVEAGLTDKSKCSIIPNSIDNSLFKVLDSLECRKRFGIGEGDFVIAFVGGFITRKGPGRVAAAISKLNDPEIKAIFVGYYSNGIIDDPICDGIVFKGALSHSEVPCALNAADVFVMPTMQEGCCNSNVEAMACGLPVISSNRSFNYDILNEKNSILIEPEDIDEIALAIKRIKDNPSYKESLRQGALEMAGELTIDKRANKIVSFIQSKL